MSDDLQIFGYAKNRYKSFKRIKWFRKKYRPLKYRKKVFQLRVRRALKRLMRFYTEFSSRSLIGLYKYVYHLKPRKDVAIYKLYLTFTSTRLFINLVSRGGRKYNYLSLSVGLFLKFFKNKKSFKKIKLLKFY